MKNVKNDFLYRVLSPGKTKSVGLGLKVKVEVKAVRTQPEPQPQPQPHSLQNQFFKFFHDGLPPKPTRVFLPTGQAIQHPLL